MNKIRYFDHSATTAVNEEVLKEMLPYFSIEYGNASSVYGIARSAKRAVNRARQKVAKAINAKEKEIYFTSGGSESDNLIIKGIAYANRDKGNHIITSKIEHHAVLDSCKTLEKEGFEVTYLNVDENGKIDIEQLKNSIKESTILITIMFANNEIGTIEPVKEIGKLARAHNIYFHTDAVQAVGNVKIDVEEMNIDALSMSGHKLYGPKGIGVLYVKNGVKFNKMQDGGHQEQNKRAGTENVPGIVGLGKAIELAYTNFDEKYQHIKELRDYYVQQVEQKIQNIKINGDKKERLPGNSNISFKFVDGEELLLKLDEKGICASTGSACTADSTEPSHVLLAIGLPQELAYGSLRITLGHDNTKEDIDFLVDTLVDNVEELRKKSKEYNELNKNT